MLNNLLETAQVAKKIKDTLESELPKNASRFKIKETLIRFINEQIGRIEKSNANSVANRQLHKTAGFEGSPLYLFLLDELVALDKLDILALPDDFKYHNEPFFVYYQRRLVENLNRFRVNKNFRSESMLRMSWAKEVAQRVVAEFEGTEVSWLPSDGSYLLMPICFVSANIWRYTGGLLLCPILPVWSALLSEVFLPIPRRVSKCLNMNWKTVLPFL